LYLLVSSRATGTRSNFKVAIPCLDKLCDRKVAQAVFISPVSGKLPLTDFEIRVIFRRTTGFLSDVFRITTTSDLKTKELSSDVERRIVKKKGLFPL